MLHNSCNVGMEIDSPGFSALCSTIEALRALYNHQQDIEGLSYCSNWSQILLSSTWCWFYVHAELHSCVVRKDFTQISEKTWEARQCTPGRAVCEGAKVKLKVRWRSQDAGKSRNVEHLRTVAGGKQSQPRKKVMKTTTISTARGQGHTNPLEFTSHYNLSQCRHMPTGLHVCTSFFILL